MPPKTRYGLALALALAGILTVLVPALAADNEDRVGVVDQSTGVWYLRSPAGGTTSFFYGNPGDFPMTGDWDCDGIDTPGLYRQSDGFVYLRNSNTQGNADIRFFFGNPGDIPLAGDFNKDGCDTVSIYRPSEARIFVINELGANDGGLGAADFDFYFGNIGDKPFTGDFTNTGQDTVGLHRESTGFVYYRNTLTTGIADNAFFFGNPGDQIITGRWAQNPNPGPDTVGIFRPSDGRFYLRFSNSQGNANVDFAYGNSDMAAVAGEFGSFPPPTGNVLSISGTQFLLDGAPFDMWGVRVSSASQDQALTNDLISNLDDYLAHGVNTITVFYMGSSGGSDDPFSNDGTSIDAGDQSRMLQIIDAADQRNMVVVVGIFYQNVVAADKNLSGWTASQEAVRTVVNALEASGYRNVIINIANEQNSSSYSDDPWSRVRNTVDLIAMCNIVHTEAPGLLCGGGGYDKTRNDDIAASADIDAVLMDNCKGCGSDTGLEMYDDLAAQGLNTKPIVNVEQFGGWTKNFLPPGVFPQTEKDAYFVEVDDALAQSGLYTFLHNNPWFQGPSTGNPVRFDLAGLGTSGDPGVAWYFEYVSETVLGL